MDSPPARLYTFLSHWNASANLPSFLFFFFTSASLHLTPVHFSVPSFSLSGPLSCCSFYILSPFPSSLCFFSCLDFHIFLSASRSLPSAVLLPSDCQTNLQANFWNGAWNIYVNVARTFAGVGGISLPFGLGIIPALHICIWWNSPLCLLLQPTIHMMFAGWHLQPPLPETRLSKTDN